MVSSLLLLYEYLEINCQFLQFVGRKDVAEFLINSGADVNAIENYFGRTPLHFAAISPLKGNLLSIKITTIKKRKKKC